MSNKVMRNDWLEEEVSDLAREGLRTLVVAKKNLTSEQYKDFEVYFKSRVTIIITLKSLPSLDDTIRLIKINYYSIAYYKKKL